MSNHITAPENCTSCGLCANVCSKNAISLVWSKDGFLIPQVDADACINCGLCVKQCIALEEKPEFIDDINSVVSYGGWNKNEKIHLKSSSGGIFTALAQWAIQQKGAVFGVVWQDKLTAAFDKAESEHALARMRGSKYTPAVPGLVYKNVLAELKTGRRVLFSGTPCQVHALHKYLRKPFDNLLTIDIVCHGAPSHLILEKYIAENEAKSGKTIDYVSFRDKPEGWLRYHVTKHYSDGSTESMPSDKDIYMRMFLCDKALNKVCYNCPYAHIPRQGDITLGDYWGVENHHREWPIDKGISAILVNTEKGQIALNTLNTELVLKEEPFDNIYKGQDVVLVRPKKQIPEVRPLILHKLRKWSLAEVNRRLVNSVKFGPTRLQTTGGLYKSIIFLIRVLRFIRRQIKA